MVFNKYKKGQAAIEFLMTYGWMLLVVLIVGALIFSFVDFGSLLPNKAELSNNLRASATESYASANTAGTGDGNSYAVIVFTYSGAKQIKIDANNSRNKITSSIDNTEYCDLTWVKNVDTDTSSSASDSHNAQVDEGSNSNNPVVFLNGQTGVAEFNCSMINAGSGLFENDALEGKTSILIANAKTGVETPSTGPVRLSVNS